MSVFKPVVLAAMLMAAPATFAFSWHATDADRGAGDLIQLALPAAGLAMTWWQDDPAGAKQWAYTMLATGVSTQVLKQSFDGTAWGERPNGGRQSFPSGHTSSACAGAAFIGRRYGWDYGLPALAPALFVGYSRVDEGLHHWRDVVAGCVLGAAFSYYLTQPKGNDELVISPGFGERLGVNVVWSF